MRPVYLDNNATTRTDPDVVAAMLPHFTNDFGNPSSAHGFGAAARGAVARARARVADLVGARAEEIVFTSGGTESDTTAILGALGASGGRKEIVVSAVEHSAVIALAQQLHRSGRARAHFVGVDARGRLDRDAFSHALSERTAVVSIMAANNETGVIFPTAELAREAHEHGALFHTDAVQAAGRSELDLGALGVDLASLSAHKFHGPKGVGALYVRRGARIAPLFHGGAQERGRRAGTENTPGIVGMARAAELARARLAGDAARMRALRDRLERGVERLAPGAVALGAGEPRLANTSAIVFPDVDAEAIAIALGRAGVAVSTGAACSVGAMKRSHVLEAMGAGVAHGAVRFSLARDTDDDDIDRVLSLLPEILARFAISGTAHAA